jgi:hypothetical protein
MICLSIASVIIAMASLLLLMTRIYLVLTVPTRVRKAEVGSCLLSASANRISKSLILFSNLPISLPIVTIVNSNSWRVAS